MSYITQFDAGSTGGLTDILGGENINITGASPVLTVNLDNVIRWPNTNSAATTGVIYLGAVAAEGNSDSRFRRAHPTDAAARRSKASSRRETQNRRVAAPENLGRFVLRGW